VVPATRGHQIQPSGMSKWHFSGTILSFNSPSDEGTPAM
jgi:hypothetical protein